MAEVHSWHLATKNTFGMVRVGVKSSIPDFYTTVLSLCVDISGTLDMEKNVSVSLRTANMLEHVTLYKNGFDPVSRFARDLLGKRLVQVHNLLRPCGLVGTGSIRISVGNGSLVTLLSNPQPDCLKMRASS
jgi:hypothetical protein